MKRTITVIALFVGIFQICLSQERYIQDSLDLYGHRPVYHFTSPTTRMLDPNGLCFWKGNWHLFYQVLESDDVKHHWGHAVSSDFIHWKDLPGAIYPGPEEQCYSGSSFCDVDRMLAVYYGKPIGEMIAEASDSLLLDWKKISGAPVIGKPRRRDKTKDYDTFDPFLWKEGVFYYMLSGSWLLNGPDGKRMPAWFLFRSKDLRNWEYRHQFVENDRYSDVGDDGACPYFLPIGDGKHILLHFSHKSGAEYLIGDYDTEKEKFNVSDGGMINNGPVGNGGTHAPSAYPVGNGKVAVIYNTKSVNLVKGVWTECMTLPQLLELDGEGRLLCTPFGDYQSLRGELVEYNDIGLSYREAVSLPGVEGKALELEIEFEKGTSDIRIDVLADPEGKEYTSIVFHSMRGYPKRERMKGQNDRKSAISIDVSNGCHHPSYSARLPETKEFFLDRDENLRLHIFIDRSVVEVFANDRAWAMLRTFPVLEESDGISIQALSGSARIKNIRAWKMNGIYSE